MNRETAPRAPHSYTLTREDAASSGPIETYLFLKYFILAREIPALHARARQRVQYNNNNNNSSVTHVTTTVRNSVRLRVLLLLLLLLSLRPQGRRRRYIYSRVVVHALSRAAGGKTTARRSRIRDARKRGLPGYGFALFFVYPTVRPRTISPDVEGSNPFGARGKKKKNEPRRRLLRQKRTDAYVRSGGKGISIRRTDEKDERSYPRPVG